MLKFIRITYECVQKMLLIFFSTFWIILFYMFYIYNFAYMKIAIKFYNNFFLFWAFVNNTKKGGKENTKLFLILQQKTFHFRLTVFFSFSTSSHASLFNGKSFKEKLLQDNLLWVFHLQKLQEKLLFFFFVRFFLYK